MQEKGAPHKNGECFILFKQKVKQCKIDAIQRIPSRTVLHDKIFLKNMNIAIQR